MCKAFCTLCQKGECPEQSEGGEFAEIDLIASKT